MYRISFIDNESLGDFFAEVKKRSNLSWMKLAKHIGSNRSMLDNYRKGKFLIPEDRFNQLLAFMDFSQRKNYIKLISKKDRNWGQIKGGLKAYKLNKKYFDLGRNKGNKDRSVKYEFNIQMPLTGDLCEFLGVIIGDGCTNKYRNLYQTQIAGDKILDKDYYLNNLSSICVNLFNISPKIVVRPKGIYMNLYSKRVFELLTKRFKIPAGKKCYTVEIPEEIINSSQDMINHTLRGMFNADGGVGFDKRSSYKNPYVRINYTSTSHKLIDQIHKILQEYNLPHSIHGRKGRKVKQVQINGEENVRSFIRKIGFSNTRHLKKLEYLNAS
ncbi:hypothetical protein CO038_00160 [Candidatus Pacearchaeota archaeon CG_4_9_14_0_2_um_filter_39_13]|nr:hypothetical protein [Candidatus Pacearchaeota archaeon]PJC45088.1 MAG: hypothetical protein CO038_00160 [Candidatus Pacearchaeota archaeon CG_4_9_14_0_2_um_filter_39_13]